MAEKRIMKPKRIKTIGTHPLRWTKWMAQQDITTIPDCPGLYQGRHTRSGKPVPIHRAKCTDRDGLLYCGEGGSLSDRFAKLVWSLINPKKKPRHNAARKCFASTALRKRYPLAGIQLRFKRGQLPLKKPDTKDIWPDVQGKNRAMDGELSGLSSYKARYGEWPPRNLIAGKKLKGRRPSLKEPKPDPVAKRISFGDGYDNLKKIR